MGDPGQITQRLNVEFGKLVHKDEDGGFEPHVCSLCDVIETSLNSVRLWHLRTCESIMTFWRRWSWRLTNCYIIETSSVRLWHLRTCESIMTFWRRWSWRLKLKTYCSPLLLLVCPVFRPLSNVVQKRLKWCVVFRVVIRSKTNLLCKVSWCCISTVAGRKKKTISSRWSSHFEGRKNDSCPLLPWQSQWEILARLLSGWLSRSANLCTRTRTDVSNRMSVPSATLSKLREIRLDCDIYGPSKV